MGADLLSDALVENATRTEIPGAAAAVLCSDEVQVAVHGVTSVDNPLPVDHSTLFQSGSIGKTFTATAMLRLVERGAVDLGAPVRRYLPELRLRDDDTARRVTVLHLLNHTAGWAGDFGGDTGEGEDALARYVGRMPELPQVSPLGSTVSYNNTSLSVAGRVIEVVHGTTYERAITELLLEPLGMGDTFFFPYDIMTRRFSVGHVRHPDGRVTVARPWGMSRAGNPAGGMSTAVGDLMTWARFHLGAGHAGNGHGVLSPDLLARMQRPTADMIGSALGDHVGISWLLRDVHGVRLVSHGGTTLGQRAELVLVPERGVAIAVLTNSMPNGATLVTQLVRWALSAYAGVDERDPQPVDRHADDLAAYIGRYETDAEVCEVGVDSGWLIATLHVKPQAAADLGIDPADLDRTAIPLGMLDADGDTYVVPEGPVKGLRGYFVRDESGAVVSVHIGGRLALRITTSKESS